jgi:hypothetical protein
MYSSKNDSTKGTGIVITKPELFEGIRALKERINFIPFFITGYFMLK